MERIYISASSNQRLLFEVCSGYSSNSCPAHGNGVSEQIV